MRRDAAREARFRTLFETHVEDVARYAARRIAAPEVHDVVSEAFLVAWRRLDHVPEDALPWLLATARRMIANRRRSATRRRALGERLSAEVTAPAAAPDPGGVDATLVAAIAGLPPAEREAFMLVAWDGLDPSRAAAAAGCAPGTFRMRLHRARARLKRELTTSATTLEESR